MSQSEETNRLLSGAEAARTAKRPYHKPSVRFEKVFETRALVCGKVQGTQGQCRTNRKAS